MFFLVNVRYPLYTATSALVGAHVVPYYLDESSTWSVSKSELQNMLNKADLNNIEVRAIVIINPGKVACCVWNSDGINMYSTTYFVGGRFELAILWNILGLRSQLVSFLRPCAEL